MAHVSAWIVALIAGLLATPPARSASVAVNPTTFASVGTIDSRFQSYNVEMIEVTGGRFWKPYGSSSRGDAPKGNTPAGMDPNVYEYRGPIDLTNRRLRSLAAALGPGYVRVSGTWANTVYFDDSGVAGSSPPSGFDGVLTRDEWKGVVDFAHAVDARIITSFATSRGTRDAAGNWTPAQARRFLAYNDNVQGDIAAVEFMNEPTYAEMGGAPKGYDAAAYARDIKTFLPFLRDTQPGALFLGPGSVGEGGALATAPSGAMLSTDALMSATGAVFDIFSYHLYAAVSQRCASMGPPTQTTLAQALSPEWLGRSVRIDAFYLDLENRYLPGKPRWITETADAACGGNPWAATFADTFRYLDEHGALARRGVRVIAHNTLASSDYGLLDERTYEPRPNYWVALLWRQLMGTRVLDPGTAPFPAIRWYAHCLAGEQGGVALLAMNTDRDRTVSFTLRTASTAYRVEAKSLDARRIRINAVEPSAGPDGEIAKITGKDLPAGPIALGPATIMFLAIPQARNPECE